IATRFPAVQSSRLVDSSTARVLFGLAPLPLLITPFGLVCGLGRNATSPLAKATKAPLKRLPVQTRQGRRWVALERVISVQLDCGLVRATTMDGQYWTKFTTLAAVHAALGPDVLFRVHRQASVNLAHVVELVRNANDTGVVRLTGGVEVVVSRSKLPS